MQYRPGPWGDTRQLGQQKPFLTADMQPPLAAAGDPPLQQTAHVNNVDFVVDPLRFGDFGVMNLNIGVNDVIVLPRAAGRRAFLRIANTHASNTLYVNYGAPASANTGETYAAGGGAFFDSVVPQNEIHLAASGANTTVTVTYCNKDIGG